MQKVGLIVAAVLYATLSFGQLQLDLEGREAYWWRQEPLPAEVYVLDPAPAAQQLVDDLLLRTAFSVNFSLLSGKVPGAVALMLDGERIVIYNEALLRQVREEDWAATGLLLQTLAHHLSSHPFTPNDNRKRLRILEADGLTGRLLARLGAGPEEALLFLDDYPARSDDPDVPSPDERRQVVSSAYREAGVMLSPKKGRLEERTADRKEEHDDLVIPSFPFPPPRASASYNLPLELLGDPATLADVDEQLSRAVNACQYVGKSYYAVPGGFALVTRIEQINPEDATPLPPPDRWSARISMPETFSIRDYLNALIFGRTGNFRVFVFIVTGFPFYQSKKTVEKAEAEKWLSDGLNRLPRQLGSKPFTEDHTCTVLVYEFQVNEVGDAHLLEPSRHSSQVHLARAGILGQLHRP